jgi:hypothetical protein
MNSPKPVIKARPRDEVPSGEGMSHEDFMAVSGLAPIPPLGRHGTVAVVAPIEYEQACRAIVACTLLEDARHWANKADALAAWAKMYGDDRVSLEARRLKLHAYRRMASLAEELLPEWAAEHQIGAERRISSLVVLKDQGLTQGIAQTVRKVGLLTDQKFDKAVNAKKPPTPGELVNIENAPVPGWARVNRAMSVLNTICANNPPVSLAKKLPPASRARAKLNIIRLSEWLRRFEEAL